MEVELAYQAHPNPNIPKEGTFYFCLVYEMCDDPFVIGKFIFYYQTAVFGPIVHLLDLNKDKIFNIDFQKKGGVDYDFKDSTEEDLMSDSILLALERLYEKSNKETFFCDAQEIIKMDFLLAPYPIKLFKPKQ